MKKKLSAVYKFTLTQIILTQLCLKGCASQNIQIPQFSNSLPNLPIGNQATNFPFINTPENNVKANGLRIVTSLPMGDGLFSNSKNVFPHSNVFQIGNEVSNHLNNAGFNGLSNMPNFNFQFSNVPNQNIPLGNIINGMANNGIPNPTIIGNGFQNVPNMPKARNLLADLRSNGLDNNFRTATGLGNTESQLANLLANNGPIMNGFQNNVLNPQLSNDFAINVPMPIPINDNLPPNGLLNNFIANNFPGNNIQPCNVPAEVQLANVLPIIVPNAASISPTLQNFQNILNELSMSNLPASNLPVNNFPFVNNVPIPNSNLDCQNVFPGGLSFLANLPVSNVPVNLPAGNLLANLPVSNVPVNLPAGNLLANLPVSNVPVNLPAGNLLANLPVTNMPLNLPVSNLPVTLPVGNLPPNNLLGNLPASNLPVSLPANLLGNLPVGNLLGNLPVVNIQTETLTKLQNPFTSTNLLKNTLSNMNMLNLGDSGSFSILSGLPIIGITESVTVLNPL